MKKVIIIGSGIAGLSAGCYLQMNGYETEIFEMHSEPGGLCAAWKRKDYLIDGCIHWFVGGAPSSGLYRIWNALIDMERFPIVVYDEFCSVKHDGKIVRLYADADRLNKELKEISPEDGKAIDGFTFEIKRFAGFSFFAEKAGEVMTIPEKIAMAWKMAPMMIGFMKWRMPVERYVKRFKSESIRHLLSTSLGGETPTFILLLNCAWLHNKSSGYPIGGARELVGRIQERYESLGGKIHFKAKVAKVIVENDAAVGIALEDGVTHRADTVISAADGRSTVMQMLEDKYRDDKIDKLYYSGKYDPKFSGIYVALGVARKFDESYKPYVFFDVKKPIMVDGEKIEKLGVTVHNFDPKAAPEGKTVLTVLIRSNDPKYWIRLRGENIKEYDDKKSALAEQVVDELNGYFGEIRKYLEVLDVATPATFVRYTNNWNGALMGWTDMSLLMNRPRKLIKGLKNFYMCGQWVADVGLPGAVNSGRDIAQIVCKKDGIEFKALTYGRNGI